MAELLEQHSGTGKSNHRHFLVCDSHWGSYMLALPMKCCCSCDNDTVWKFCDKWHSLKIKKVFMHSKFEEWPQFFFIWKLQWNALSIDAVTLTRKCCRPKPEKSCFWKPSFKVLGTTHLPLDLEDRYLQDPRACWVDIKQKMCCMCKKILTAIYIQGDDICWWKFCI